MSGQAEIFTDGGCLGNPGPGGWGYVIRVGEKTIERSGYDPSTTNNRMELTAVLEALKELAAHPEWASVGTIVVTDSQYVQKGITQWVLSWVRNGWKTSGRKPVKNVDLWMDLWERSRHRPIAWKWVMGHSGDRWNERCHSLVEEAVKRGA